MDILILNSSNLPEGLENELKNVDGESPDVKSEDIELKPNQSDFDLFIHKELQRIFSDKHNYDLIILPYSFSLDNYTEFTGLTTALHIRLTLQWEMTRVPLLFIGPDPKEEVERFSPYGLLLETSSVYTTNLKDSANLYEFIKTLGVHPLSNSQYQTFLSRIKIGRPSNYPTHHSVANNWALMRWINLLIWPDGNKPTYRDEHFESMPYIKYVMAVNGYGNVDVNEEWKKANSIEAKIDNISGKRICLIEDKINKGWGEFFDIVFQNSGASMVPYSDFNSSYKREELLSKIKSFIDNTDPNIDVYILDLRLHETDTYADSGKLTGHEIAEYIHGKNVANQVIVLTASNKVWNYHKEMDECHAYGYIVKESPEIYNTAKQSVDNFKRLASKIEESSFLSYFKNFSSFLKEKNISEAPLLAIEELFVGDKTLNKEIALGTIIINLVEFAKDYIGRKYELHDLKIIYTADNSTKVDIKGKAFVESVKINDYPQTTKVVFYSKIRTSSPIMMVTPKRKDIDVLALHYCYGIDILKCNLYLKAKYDRNTSLAHYGGKSYLLKEKLKTLIQEVVLPILKNDY